MSINSLGRDAGEAHLTGRGAGWLASGASFLTAAGVLNLLTTPAVGFKVDEFSAARRSSIQVLPDGWTLLATQGSIDAKAETITTLLTVPAGYQLQVVAAFMRCTAASAITVPASARLGADGEGDVYESQIMSGLFSAGFAYRFPTGGANRVLIPGEDLVLGIDVAATGTSQTLEAHVFGRVFEL